MRSCLDSLATASVAVHKADGHGWQRVATGAVAGKRKRCFRDENNRERVMFASGPPDRN